MSTEALQKVFKTFSDPTRLRILALLEREELAVQELMDILGMAQSRVSRHLAILREAGLLRDRRDGTYVFYRFEAAAEGPWREAWELARRSLDGDSTTERDTAALGRAMQARSGKTRSFFDSVGPEWDAVRKVFNDDALRARGIARLVAPDLLVADIGTGTGVLAAELAALGLRVIAVDNSERMLGAARANFERDGLERIELRAGDVAALPIETSEVDAALAHMVLHYLPSPAEALGEMARCVKPGGTVVVVDFVSHQHEWMRQELGVHWLGFAEDEVEGWFRAAGLCDLRREVHQAPSAGRDLPETFIASARVPS
ncbi:MAG: ArsR family transcriptional regulator [Deltaproteobacteria bacterium]|nr:ArsR family transcriptional regulator [Deltaproteobacteria bacterium]MBW2398276.1 ArsR family transcriptional regulator [Deltaproteobacteria bacterium]